MLRELPAAASAKLGPSTSKVQLRTIIAIRNRRMARLSVQVIPDRLTATGSAGYLGIRRETSNHAASASRASERHHAGFERLARPERLELPTPRFVVWCSIQLSYGR